MIYGLRGFHSYWTKPQLVKRGRIAMQDFEILTMALSACTFRRLGYPMNLVTDTKGAQFLQRVGVLQCYDNVYTSLDKLTGVNPSVFFAAGKNLAYEQMQTPCVSIDMDAVMWRMPEFDEFNTDLVVLHEDILEWDCYHSSKELYGELGFKSGFWNWNVKPYNVAVLLFNNAYLRTAYTSMSQMFMENYSRFYNREYLQDMSKDIVKFGRHPRVFEQIFAEQQLLAMIANRMKARVCTISSIDASTDHLMSNPVVTHLWGIKSVYRANMEVKDALVAGLLNMLGKNYPETRRLCGYVQKVYDKTNRDVSGDMFEGSFQFNDTRVLDDTSDSGSVPYQSRVLKVLEVQGDVVVGDICFGFKRRVRKGGVVVVGESIFLKEGAFCVLMRGGKAVVVKAPENALHDKDGWAKTKVVKKVKE